MNRLHIKYNIIEREIRNINDIINPDVKILVEVAILKIISIKNSDNMK
ncbi:hypothetical protein [Sporosalibacterium faouarense]|nr:hypothetical protein [Sporosalibacterium faouarense]